MIVKVEPELLQTLHRILRQKTDLNDRLQRGPRQKQVAQGAEKSVQDELKAAQEQLKKLKMQADEKQLQLKSREDKIDDLKGKRNACDSNRDFQLLSDQISADEAANLVLSDEILECLENIDVQEAEVNRAKQNLESVSAETKKTIGEIDGRLKVLGNDLSLVEKELQETEAKLPSEMKSEYLRLVEANGEDALAALDEGCCGNCYTIQSPQTLDQLRMKQTVNCGSCGSFIYLAQSSSVAS